MILQALSALALSTLLPMPAASASPTIVGQWETLERSKGGVGEFIEFREDGSFLQAVVAIGDSTYKVWEDSLLTFWKDSATGKTPIMSNKLEFEGDDLILRDEQGSILDRFSRLERGRISDPPLVGKWCSENMPGMTTLREYTRDGKMFIRLPISTVHGRYGITGETLTTQYGSSTPKIFRFRVEDGLLIVVPESGGAEKKFKPAETTLLKSLS